MIHGSLDLITMEILNYLIMHLCLREKLTHMMIVHPRFQISPTQKGSLFYFEKLYLKFGLNDSQFIVFNVITL